MWVCPFNQTKQLHPAVLRCALRWLSERCELRAFTQNYPQHHTSADTFTQGNPGNSWIWATTGRKKDSCVLVLTWIHQRSTCTYLSLSLSRNKLPTMRLKHKKLASYYRCKGWMEFVLQSRTSESGESSWMATSFLSGVGRGHPQPQLKVTVTLRRSDLWPNPCASTEPLCSVLSNSYLHLLWEEPTDTTSSRN